MNFFDQLTGESPPLIRQALDDVRVMLDTAHEMTSAAGAWLLDGTALPFDLDAKDELLDEREQDIRRKVVEHLAVNPRQEMVLSLILVSIVEDAERLGDLARTLAGIAGMARHPLRSAHVDPLRALLADVLGLFDQTREAFLEGEADQARAVMSAGVQAKDEATAYLHALAEDDDLDGNEALVLGTAAQAVGRIAAHLANITSSVALPFDKLRRDDE